MLDVDARQAPAYVIISWPNGRVDADELAAMCERLHDQGLLTDDTRVMVDARTMGDVPSLQQVRSATARAGTSRYRPFALALLVHPGVQYGVARQVIALLPISMAGDAFTDETEAWLWLRSLR